MYLHYAYLANRLTSQLNCCTFTGILFAHNKHIFVWLLVRQLTGQLLCTIYKSNLASGLTLHFTLLFWILSDLSASVSLNVHFLCVSLIHFQVALCFSICSTFISFYLVTLRILDRDLWLWLDTISYLQDLSTWHFDLFESHVWVSVHSYTEFSSPCGWDIFVVLL